MDYRISLSWWAGNPLSSFEEIKQGGKNGVYGGVYAARVRQLHQSGYEFETGTWFNDQKQDSGAKSG